MFINVVGRGFVKSGSGRKSGDGLLPLLGLPFGVHELVRPGTGEVNWRPDQECETLPGAGFPNLLVEFEGISGEMSAHIEQYHVIHLGLPQKSRCLEALRLMYLDAVTAQDGRTHLARTLITVDEENRLALKNWRATKWWWAIHTALPKVERPLWEGI